MLGINCSWFIKSVKFLLKMILIVFLFLIFRIFSELSKVQQTENLDLFLSSVYGWLSNSGDSPNSDIRAALNDAITQSAIDWYKLIYNLEFYLLDVIFFNLHCIFL